MSESNRDEQQHESGRDEDMQATPYAELWDAELGRPVRQYHPPDYYARGFREAELAPLPRRLRRAARARRT